MSPRLTCTEARDLLPELALGQLAGDRRAEVLDHLGVCAACETETSELAAAVDDLLKLTPEIDPPAGFESAVLARTTVPDGRRRWSRRRVVAAVGVAAAALVATAGWLIIGTRQPDRGVDAAADRSIQALGGKDLRAAPLAWHGERWGQAFVFEGKTSWVFVSMSWDAPDGAYRVVLDRSDGPSATVARLHLVRGLGSVGMTVGDTRTVTAVRIVDDSGHTVCTAALPVQT